MFDNIGNKIKSLAKVMCWICILASVIAAFVVIAATGETGLIPGIAIAVIGSLLSWVGSFVLYGFGEMVENSDIRTELAVKAATEKKGE